MSTYTLDQVAQHNKETDCWIVIDGQVYDVTKFLADHPGGKKVLLKVGGLDASKQFASFHNAQQVLQKYGPSLHIGLIGSAQASASTPKPEKSKSKGDTFGELVPFAEPAWYQGSYSPYYNDSHRRYRAALRVWVDENLAPFADQWEEQKTFPIREVAIKAAKAGVLGAAVGSPWPTKYAGANIIGGVKPEEFDAFHELIFNDEVCRTGSYGSACAWMAGLSIGLPPVLDFGSEALKSRIATECLSGEKIICLAITEPAAGSDVATIQCEAKLSEDGKHFIVNGEKKWITNGIYSDYFTTAVRTGPGRNLSVLVIERGPGVTTKQMSCMGLTTSGTTFITFEDVKVPVENLLGKINEGFAIIMNNFNHERMGVNISANRFARVCYEEAFKYACKRETFGKKLIEHPVIREKLAHMAKKILVNHAFIEDVTYQLTKMSHKEANAKLGGVTALMKSQCTETFEYCTREASQIFGGLAYTKGGQGGKIERLFREARVYTVFAGSEEIMLDLGIRLAARQVGAKM